MMHRLLGEWQVADGEVTAHTVCGQVIQARSSGEILRSVSRWPLLVTCPECREAE